MRSGYTNSTRTYRTAGGGPSFDVTDGEAALFEVLLVVLLGAVEGTGGDDLGHDGPLEAVLRGEPRDRRLGRGLLRGGMVEDRRAVLLAHVRALAVRGRGIVVRPEHVQEILVFHAGRIIRDLHRLRVAGAVGAHVLVRRIRRAPSGIADLRRDDTLDLAKRGLDAPETSGGDRGLLHARGLLTA